MSEHLHTWEIDPKSGIELCTDPTCRQANRNQGRRAAEQSASSPVEGEDDILERLRPDDGCCAFCGRDPYEYVDNGVGMERVAVTCCDEGIALYQHGDEVLSRQVALRYEAAAEIERLRLTTRSVAVTSEAVARIIDGYAVDADLEVMERLCGIPQANSTRARKEEALSKAEQIISLLNQARKPEGDDFQSWLENEIDEASMDVGAAHQEGASATPEERQRVKVLAEVHEQYLKAQGAQQ